MKNKLNFPLFNVDHVFWSLPYLHVIRISARIAWDPWGKIIAWQKPMTNLLPDQESWWMVKISQNLYTLIQDNHRHFLSPTWAFTPHFSVNQALYLHREDLIHVKFIQPRVTFETTLTLSVLICAGHLMSCNLCILT